MAELTSRQRAAAVLAQLDDERASLLFAKLSDAEVIALSAEVAHLPIVSQDDLVAVASELSEKVASFAVSQGSPEVARRLLATRLGDKRAASIMEEVSRSKDARPLAFLDGLHPASLARSLEDEHPQVAAVVLANLASTQAALALDCLRPETRTETARRLVVMTPPSHLALRTLSAELERRLITLSHAVVVNAEANGVQTLAEIVTKADRATEEKLLAGLESVDADLVAAVRAQLFGFNDLVGLEAGTLRVVLQSADTSTIALALKGKSEDVVSRVTELVSDRRRSELMEELSALPPQRVREVRTAEGSLIALALRLAEQEEISLNRGDEPLLG